MPAALCLSLTHFALSTYCVLRASPLLGRPWEDRDASRCCPRLLSLQTHARSSQGMNAPPKSKWVSAAKSETEREENATQEELLCVQLQEAFPDKARIP